MYVRTLNIVQSYCRDAAERECIMGIAGDESVCSLLPRAAEWDLGDAAGLR